MQFLAYCQTYVGVVASLLVLCLVLDRSNIIQSLLKGTRDNVRKSTVTLKSRVECIEAEALKRLQQSFARNKKGNGNADSDLADAKLRMGFIISDLPLRIEVIKHAEAMLRHVDNMRIRVLAPVYSLICCIGLFMLDCMNYLWPRLLDWCMSFGTLLLLLSTAFWGVHWYRSIQAASRQYGLERRGRKHRRLTSDCSYSWRLLRNAFANRSITLQLITLALMLAWFLIFDVMAYHAVAGTETRLWIIYAGGVLPVITWASVGMCPPVDREHYPYRHAVKHWVYVSVYSLALTAIMLLQSEWFGYNVLLPFSDTRLLVVGWCLFLTANGLILPCLVPYLKYIQAGEMAKHEVDDYEGRMDKAVSGLLADIEA